MLRKAGLLSAALAMFSIAGGHWAVVQSVAWGQMLADYARQSGSVVTAVEQTFDGEHPCALCKEIASARAQEQVAERSGPAAPDGVPKPFKTEKKGDTLETWILPVTLAGLTAVEVPWPATAVAPALSCPEAPPVPPPRADHV